MGLKDVSETFKAMSQEDKAALKALQAEESTRIGKPLSLREIIEAVTPGMPDPDYLK